MKFKLLTAVKISALIGFIALGLFGFWMFKQLPKESYRQETLPFQTATVLYWFNNGNLLIKISDQLILYNPESRKLVKTVFAPEKPYKLTDTKCVSDETGIVQLLPESAFRENGINYSKQEIRRFKDWNHTNQYETIPYMEWWQTNLLDCQPYDYKTEKAKTYRIDNKLVTQDMGFPKLLKTTHGMTEAYETKTSDVWRILIRNGSAIDRSLDLKIPQFARIISPGTITPWYDGQKNQYLWYTTRMFSESSAKWLLPVWVILPQMTLKKSFFLPAGPWVYPHSFWKQLSCFSCGCSCYEHLALQMENDRIYMMVWGEAVEKKHQGIYVLQNDPNSMKTTWNPVALGDIDPQFSVSPDGCQVAYNKNNQVLIATICKH